jgi:hypothetical protein
LFLGSSHGRNTGTMLQGNLGNKFYTISIFELNAPLSGVVVDLRKLGKGLTKQDHIVIVGGPGKSLDRKYYYSVKKYIRFVAERKTNTNVEPINLFKWLEKQWMNTEVRRVNL